MARRLVHRELPRGLREVASQGTGSDSARSVAAGDTRTCRLARERRRLARLLAVPSLSHGCQRNGQQRHVPQLVAPGRPRIRKARRIPHRLNVGAPNDSIMSVIFEPANLASQSPAGQ